MRRSTGLLIRESLNRWTRAPGVAMLLIVALMPALLTGAWAWTHQDDLSIADIRFGPADPRHGDTVEIFVDVQNEFGHDVGPFNVTVLILSPQVGPFGGINFVESLNETLTLDGIGADDKATVSTTWTAVAGQHQVNALVDFFENDLPEIEEANNIRTERLLVGITTTPTVSRDAAVDPANTTADTTDLQVSVSDIEVGPEERHAGDNLTFSVRVINDGPDTLDNATFWFNVTLYGQSDQRPLLRESTTVGTLAAGEDEEFTYTVQNAGTGQINAQARLRLPSSDTTDDPSDNAQALDFLLLTEQIPDPIDAHATAKAFYRDIVLLPMHFTLLVPLIGLFYAGGVLQDERNKGDLVYLLTRPVSRAQLPLVRFASSFGIAFAAVAIGVVLTYFLLLAQTTTPIDYLWWPLVFGALVLLMYAGAASLLGVVSDRPYLAGLLYILGFETLVAAGRRILINDQPILQDWVLRLSLNHWVTEGYAAWDPDASGGVASLADGAGFALVVMVAIGVVGIVASTVLVRRKQFED